MSNPISHLPPTTTSDAFSQSPAAVNAPGQNDSDSYPGAYTSGLAKAQPRVSHHVHREDEPLPGAQGGASSVDYSSNAMRNAVLPPFEVGDTQDFHPAGSHHHHTPEHPVNPFERTTVGGSSSPGTKTSPLPPVPGYAGTTENREHNISGLQSPDYDIDGKRTGEPNFNQPTGKVSMGDKVVGKTEQIAGKITGNADLQERGVARSHGMN
ncbi:hypothetical protein BJ912DRAFT_928354 [Pholiota molesta]|nr:hypothetical protein BJ912DRAFT_928354 [Pholiota molesta]